MKQLAYSSSTEVRHCKGAIDNRSHLLRCAGAVGSVPPVVGKPLVCDEHM